MLEVTACPGWSIQVHGKDIESFRVVPVSEREAQEEPLTFSHQKDFYDRVISDAENGKRKMPHLFGKPATELSKRELLALTIALSGPMETYVSKDL
jgi:hypothetical protein